MWEPAGGGICSGRAGSLKCEISYPAYKLIDSAMPARQICHNLDFAFPFVRINPASHVYIQIPEF